jgi:ubiquinone/menaquinone biosynthesis C-methylase UbiE
MKPPASTARANERLRRFYNESAAGYDQWMRYYNRAMLGDGRRQVCARARGQTLELAVGTGLNLAWYPREVALTGVDLSPAILALAARRAQQLGREVTLRPGDAHALEFPDGHFDTVVATLLLSTIPACWRAAGEAWRVLKPGGQLLLLDHVRSPVAPVRWAERLLDPLLARLTGVHLLRDPLDHLGAVGFAIERCRRTRWGVIEEVVARKG